MVNVAVLLAMLGCLAALIVWHSRTYAYICENCRRRFEASPLKDLAGAQWPPNRKYMKCTACGQHTWAEVVRKRTA